MTTIASAAGHVALFQARDILRSRWLVAYTLFFLLSTEALLRFSSGDAGTILSLASIVLYVVPLATLVIGAVYVYNAREFLELLLAQPVERRGLFLGLYFGLIVPMASSVTAGIAIPFLVRGFTGGPQRIMLAVLLASAVALTLVFAGLSLCIALRTDDRLRGLGAAVGAWLLGAVLYDGLVLGVVAAFADHSLERPMLALVLANPIDLARVALLLQLDVPALMGYTGAVFEQFLGGSIGIAVVTTALVVWIGAPVMLGMRLFRRKDF